MPNISRKTPFRKRDGSTMMICKQSPSYFPVLPEAHRPAESRPSASRMTMSFKGIKVSKSNAAPAASSSLPDCADNQRRIIRYICSIAPFVLFDLRLTCMKRYTHVILFTEVRRCYSCVTGRMPPQSKQGRSVRKTGSMPRSVRKVKIASWSGWPFKCPVNASLEGLIFPQEPPRKP